MQDLKGSPRLTGSRPRKLIGTKWDMGWVTPSEWRKIANKKFARVIDINPQYKSVVFYRGSTITYEIKKARKYWIDRLMMITMHFPSFGATETRIERVYPKKEEQ